MRNTPCAVTDRARMLNMFMHAGGANRATFGGGFFLRLWVGGWVGGWLQACYSFAAFVHRFIGL